MRTSKLEIVELDRDHRAVLYRIACDMREAYNFIWRQWESWHTQHDSATALRACLAADKAWHQAAKAARGPRPKWSVQPWPNDFAKHLYRLTTRRFPQLNSRVIVLLLQRIRQVVTTKQSSAAATKWWIAILLDLDGRGSSVKPQPIPFDSANAKVFPADEKGRVWLEMRLDRIERPGKKTGTSTVIRAALKTGGKRAAYAKPAHEMASGERKLSGAQVTYDVQKKKWFACLTYAEEKIAVQVDADRMAVLSPGRARSCWRLRFGGRTMRLAGRGHHVAHVRKALLMQRWSRQHSYTFIPKRKGRSRRNALGPLYKLSNRWLNFTKSCNQQFVADVVKWAVDHGVGRIVLMQGAENRLLASVGKVDGREDSTGWPWYQVEQLLQQSCQRHSIKVELHAVFRGQNHSNAAGDKVLQKSS